MQRRAFCALPLGVAAMQASEAGAPRDAIEGWKDNRFGLFIHWGPVSIVGTEIGWSRGGPRRGWRDEKGGTVPVEVYDNLYRMFDPVKFNAAEWVRNRGHGFRRLGRAAAEPDRTPSQHGDGGIVFRSRAGYRSLCF